MRLFRRLDDQEGRSHSEGWTFQNQTGPGSRRTHLAEHQDQYQRGSAVFHAQHRPFAETLTALRVEFQAHLPTRTVSPPYRSYGGGGVRAAFPSALIPADTASPVRAMTYPQKQSRSPCPLIVKTAPFRAQQEKYKKLLTY